MKKHLKPTILCSLLFMCLCGFTSIKKEIPKPEFAGYLFAYFEGSGDRLKQEQLRFGVSADAVNWYALNNNQPIIASDAISQTGGIRDPYIMRGENEEAFYMVATDMFTFKNGWGHNPGIIMMKSENLIDWKHSIIDLAKLYPQTFHNVQWVWAPQVVYDPAKKKYLVYFTIRFKGQENLDFYCAYANKDFSGFEKEPKMMFRAKYGAIDGDIIYKDGLYHFFFKGNTKDENGKEIKNGIQQATSKSLHGPWKEDFKYLDSYAEKGISVEGSSIFKLNNSDEYILMYDLYKDLRYEFQRSTDLFHFTEETESFTKNFNPRHGSVISITKEEARRLNVKWGGVPTSLLQPEDGAMKRVVMTTEGVSQNNPVIPGFHADPEVLYSQKTGKFYLYPTSDGYKGWGGYYFKAFSSDDLVNWKEEGVFLDLKSDQVSWATGNGWAPCIEEKNINGKYKYFFYYSGQPVNGGGKQIGVAVADSPTGPFTDLGKPMIDELPLNITRGQNIDGDVFIDPISGKSYFYWGNGFAAVAELNDDMVSINPETTRIITPQGGTLENYAYREGLYVFYRKGLYYFMWSVDDTGSPNYHVAYGTSSSPLGPITVAKDPIVIKQDPGNNIYGTGHNSVIQLPETDEWYIVYHRINKDFLNNGPGFHREVCIDKLHFNEDGTIERTIPTNKGIAPVTLTP